MTQRKLTSSRWLISALAAITLWPAATQARHPLDRGLLIPVVDRLHANALRFEQLACQRRFPRHELDYVQLMTKKACRLAAGVRCDAPYGRVRADYNILRAFARTVDHRLNRRRDKRHGHHLIQCWNSLQCDLEEVGCLIDCCARGCRHASRGHMVSYVGATMHDAHGSPRRYAIRPAATTTCRGKHHKRYVAFTEPRPYILPVRVVLSEEHDHERRSASAAPPWVDLLIAALPR